MTVNPAKIDKISSILKEDIQDVFIHTEGTAFEVYEVNKQFMFKFPRRESDFLEQEEELYLVNNFACKLPRPVTKFFYADKSVSVCYKFKGQTLTANFFNALHKVDCEAFPEKFLQTKVPRWQQTENQIHVDNFFDKIELKQRAGVESFLTDNSKLTLKNKKLIHGDFSPARHVFMKKGVQVEGIINFSVQIKNPAYEFI